jgi:hypothetical protein
MLICDSYYSFQLFRKHATHYSDDLLRYALRRHFYSVNAILQSRKTISPSLMSYIENMQVPIQYVTEYENLIKYLERDKVTTRQ